MLATLYSNLSVYHINGKGKLSETQSSKYIDGAILSQMKQQRSSQASTYDLNLGISYNNRAVLELKKKNLQAAMENSVKAIDLLEPKLYGMLHSGLIQKLEPGFPMNDVNYHF